MMNSLPGGNALLALAAATLWGGSDFSGGMGVKRAGGDLRGGLRVVLMSHVSSLCVLLTIARMRGFSAPHGSLLWWGLAAGVLGGLSLTAFYVALSRGAMGASAAVSGLLAAAIPAAVSLAMDGSPGVRPLIGFVVAGVAIWLIAAGPSAESADATGRAAARTTMTLATLAGMGFGFYFVALKMAGPAGVVWSMALARVGSIAVCAPMLLWVALRGAKANAGQRVRLGLAAVAWTLAAALMDTSGNMLFIAATRTGRLDIASVLASLYPAGTILLAAVALGERPTRRQAMGMATAMIAVGLITL
jgi:drug/metabolite transporter (DMT)-like permease